MGRENLKMVVLDGYTNNPGDITWAPIAQYGELTVYDRSDDANWWERTKHADILFANKFVLSRSRLDRLPHLKCIVVLATGYNNIDIPACREKRIQVFNAVGYSGESVSQYVLAAMLAWQNRIESHATDVNRGGWAQCPDFSYRLTPWREVSGMTLGIVGFGKIGQTVGKKASALGMKVLAYHKHPDRDRKPWMEMVSLSQLLQESDVITLHVPLTEETTHIINADSLDQMLPHTLLINTGRGGLVNEADLIRALQENKIAGAILDVLDQEPPPKVHPLCTMSNCWVTPHMAWTSQEARRRLIEISAENVDNYLHGRVINRVV